MVGISAVTAVIYAGTIQSLNGLARELLACELLAHGTLYQSFALHNCELAAIVFLSSK